MINSTDKNEIQAMIDASVAKEALETAQAIAASEKSVVKRIKAWINKTFDVS